MNLAGALASESTNVVSRHEPWSFVASLSPAMRAIEQALADIAPTDIPVLLVGESGSGKDSLAVHLHRLSRRSKAPFLKVSCAALTLETLRDLTNGAARGNGNGRGAHAGTLFLDEICDLDPACQPRLLALLPDGVSEADGNIGQGVRERLVCATSRNLEEQLRAGRFREELYFRINGVCLRVPPLRHRREDILPLLDFFLEKHAAELARPKPSMSSRALQVTLAHAWPGNLRELENFARKIVAFGDDRAAAAELGNGHELLPAEPQNGGLVSLKEAGRAASRQAEKELILKALARTRWNRKRAAQELRISYKALLYKLKEIGLDESLNASPKKES